MSCHKAPRAVSLCMIVLVSYTTFKENNYTMVRGIHWYIHTTWYTWYTIVPVPLRPSTLHPDNHDFSFLSLFERFSSSRPYSISDHVILHHAKASLGLSDCSFHLGLG